MLDAPINNKMMQTPPAKKGFHFPSDGAHLAEFVEAETIEEAEAIYHKVKRAVAAPEQSTVSDETKEDVNG